MTQSQPVRGRQVIEHARVVDVARGHVGAAGTVVVEDGRIAAVHEGATLPVDDAVRRIDAGGRLVVPGLIDAHVHVTALDANIPAQALWPASYVAAGSLAMMKAMLERGFTTVRDAGGADLGLQQAQQQGLFPGPRLFIAGFPLSQTGGHADLRARAVRTPHDRFFCSCAGLGLIGAICDGVGEVRRATREQIRTGANQIKIMAGGGVASPADPLEGTQFALDELTAICEEAEAAGVYAMAHAYSPRAVTRAVRCGVRSIEHGNLIDEATAREMKKAGAFYVPTLSTYAAGEEMARASGWSDEMRAKLARVRDRGLDAIRLAQAEGVPIVFGTDLLGSVQPRQNGEFLLRAPVLSALDILRSATVVAARMMRLEGEVGELRPGCHADLLIVDGDPTVDAAVLADPERHVKLVMQGGRVVVERR